VGHILDLRETTQTLSAVAGYFAFYGVGDNLLSGGGEPERLTGVPVSDNFFDVLGVTPLLGRGSPLKSARGMDLKPVGRRTCIGEASRTARALLGGVTRSSRSNDERGRPTEHC
jgi:hypothetical protein